MSQEKICPTCGTEYPANERFCPRDGTALRSQGGGNDLVGSIIAERYHVLKKLGEGGMGQVYLAEHVKMGRKSAVKVMNPGMVHDADAISRFNREAANASRINHPNVAGIYDFGETDEGLIYLAMEFIEGESLTSLVERSGALPPLRAANIAKQAADGLQVAHDMGIVHRDLKPDNIMIAKNRDGSDCVKVVDFGIAKAAGAENQKVTKTGLVVGTPEYMSPEQLAGDKLDGRSDVYSLALVTFNMLTGTLPFVGESAQESMIMRLTDEPRTLAQVKPDVTWPKDVQDVMAKALQRKAGERYQKAEDFGNALYMAIERMPKSVSSIAGTQILDGATALMTAPPPTRAEASASPVTQGTAAVAPAAKSKVPMLAGGGVLAAAAAVAAFMILSKNSSASAKPDSAATVPPAAVTATADPAAGTTDLPATQYAKTSGTPVAGGASGTPVTSAPSPSPSAKGAEAPTGLDIGARLPILLSEAAEDVTAARALREAGSLMPKASGDQIVGLNLVQASAYGLSNDTAKACRILRSIKVRARGTIYEKDVVRLLESC